MENFIFDYHTLAKKLLVPSEIIQKFEKEANDEFPLDAMLMEIHVLRAIKSYARTAVIEN